jgi:biotin carboxyl carrier protein
VKFEAQIDGAAVPVEVEEQAGRHVVVVGEERLEIDARPVAAGCWSLCIGDACYLAAVAEDEGGYVVEVDGESHRIRVEEETRYVIRTRGGRAGAGGQVLKAPMSGRVVLVEVAPGQAVRPGDGLVILEAMKMENEFRATAAGTVREVRVQAGQAVNAGDVLVVIDA